MSPATAQIIIQLDPETGEFRAELPSPNGSRRKLDLPTDPSLWGDLIGVELLELNSWLRDQDKRAEELKEFNNSAKAVADREFTLARSRTVWQQTAQQFGKAFADGKLGEQQQRQQAAIAVAHMKQLLKRTPNQSQLVKKGK